MQALIEDAPPERPTGLRGLIYGLVTWPAFDLFILFVIISSCAVMATQSPIKEKNGTYTPEEVHMYAMLEDIFLWIFTAEVCLKQLAYGPAGYFSEAWNSFDFVVVSTAWIRVIFPEAGNLTVLRAVRVLRALRMVNRVPSLKKIVKTLIGAFPELANVVALFCMFIFLFGILGVNLFEGKLHFRCTEPGATGPIDDTALCNVDADCEGAQTCVYYELGPNFGATSYDDVISACATIFQAVTLEGWVDQMYELEKTTSKATAILFYLIVVLIGAFFLVNLFLAVLFDAFAKQATAEDELAQDRASQAEHEAQLAAEAAQRAMVAEAKTAQDVENGQAAATGEGDELALLKQTTGGATPPFRRSSSRANYERLGEQLVYGLIMLNTASMCSNYAGESQEWIDFLYVLNVFFTSAFFFEMTVKLCTLGRTYFDAGWNRFDFFVTWCSVVDLVLEVYGHNTQLLRALRVARVMRLLRLNRKMRRFEETFDKVASLVVNLSAILVLFMVMFAMLGMELFGAKMGSPPPRTHFDDFSSALVTVFCISSGEDWNAVFAAALENGANWSVSALYFIPLFLMDNYILVNLFVAIICWGWEQADDTEFVVGFTLTCHGAGDVDSLFTSETEAQLRSCVGSLVLYGDDSVKAKARDFVGHTFSVDVRVTPSNPRDIERLVGKLSAETLMEEVGRVDGLRVEASTDGAEMALEEEEEMAVEKARLYRAHELVTFNVAPPATEGSLVAEHELLKAAIVDLAKAKKLGMTDADASALCTALDAPLLEYAAAASSVVPPADAQAQAPLITAEGVAGLTIGFSTLVLGTRQLLSQLTTADGAEATPSEATALLLQYFDAPHARMKRQPDDSLRLVPKAAERPPQATKKGGGGKGGKPQPGGPLASSSRRPSAPSAAPPAASPAAQLPVVPLEPLALRISGSRLMDQLELLMKQYVTALALSSNTALSEGIERVRISARATRSSAQVAVRKPTLLGSLGRCVGDCWGACCGSAVAGPEDPLGRSFLPLGDTGAAARLRLVREIVQAPAFEGFIQLCILCSSAALAFDMPSVVDGSQLDLALRMGDKIFTSIFVVEMSLKLVAFGAFAPPDGYFRSPWNQARRRHRHDLGPLAAAHGRPGARRAAGDACAARAAAAPGDPALPRPQEGRQLAAAGGAAGGRRRAGLPARDDRLWPLRHAAADGPHERVQRPLRADHGAVRGHLHHRGRRHARPLVGQRRHRQL